MRFLRIVVACCFVAASLFVSAQTSQPHRDKTSAVDFVRDVAGLIATHFPSKAAVRSGADRLAHRYAAQLSTISKKVDWVKSQATTQFNELGWQQKLNLACELWRVRSSLDLLCLASPEVFTEITGMGFPDLKGLLSRFGKAETAIEQRLPVWGR